MGSLLSTRKGRREAGLVAVQLAVLTLAALLFSLLPAAGAPVVLVPLGERNAAALIGKHTKLIGLGRFGGSLVVSGERPSVLAALVHDNVLILPALPFLCGGSFSPESQ